MWIQDPPRWKLGKLRLGDFVEGWAKNASGVLKREKKNILDKKRKPVLYPPKRWI